MRAVEDFSLRVPVPLLSPLQAALTGGTPVDARQLAVVLAYGLPAVVAGLVALRRRPLVS